MGSQINESLSGIPDGGIEGRYHLVRELGRGGMGIVYLVQDTSRNNKEIVLKVFHSIHADPETIEILRREFAILSALRHPNLVHVDDFGKFADRDEYYYTMEFIQGKEFLPALKEYSMASIQASFVQVVQALGYIHASGILHGDIKSENIMVIHQGGQHTIKLMDFGLAVREDERIKQTLSGTLEYMAPELFQNARVSISSDLYALGILMYWAISGKAPFTGTPEQIKKAHLRTIPPRLSSLGIDIPPRLESVIQRLLAKDPVERFSSCEEVLTAIGIKDHDSSKTRDLITPLIMDSFLKERDHEIQSLLDQISTNLQPAHSNQANFIVMSGTEGSGHYRILQDVKSKIQLDNIAVLEGWCRDDKYSVYQPFIDAFRGFRELEELILETDATLSDTRLERDERDLKRYQYMEEISKLVRNQCRHQRVVLMIHHLEIANDAVLDLIYYLGRALKQERISIIVSIITDRQTEKNTLKIQHGRDSLSTVFDFRVKRLAVPELESVLSTAFMPALLPQGFYNELHEKSGGNIEIVAAVMTALNNSGFFLRSDKTWMLSETYDLSKLDLSNIDDLYFEAYKNLTEEQQTILNYIAVYDSVIDKRFLYALLEKDKDIEHDLLVLSERRILFEQSFNDVMQTGFLSSAFQASLLKKLDVDLVKSIQDRIVRLMIKLPEIDHNFDQMAYHMLSAGHIETGLFWALRALKNLKHSYSNRRALQISELALSNCNPENKRLYRVFKRTVADMQDIQGNSRSALEHYQQLVSVYRKGVAKSALLRKTSYLHQRLGEVDKARDILNEALQQVSNDATIERALILREISWIYIMQGSYKQAIAIGIQALKELPESTPSRTLAITLNSLGGASFYAGEIEKAIEYFSSSALVKKELGDKRSMAATFNNLGIVFNVSGDPVKASEYWRSSMEIMEEVGDWAGLAENYNNLGILLMESGQYERAYNYYKKCRDLKNRIGDLRGLVASHCNIGELLYLREDYSGALHILEEGIKFAERIKSDSIKAEMLYQLGRVYTALYQVKQAKIANDGCLKIMQSLQDKSKLGEYLVQRARIHLLETGEFENEFIHRAEELVKNQTNQPQNMMVHLYYVEYWIDNNNVKDAIKLFSKLQGYLDNFNLKWYQLEILILLAAAMLKSDKPQAMVEKTLERAEKLAHSMGLMLKLKTIYHIRGHLQRRHGDNINSYKSFRKAYQCLKLCLTHIEQEEYKQSLISIPDNIDLLESIKKVKALLSAA